MGRFMKRIKLFVFGFFGAMAASGASFAQDNATCDAACNVPCYFGECAPAKASYEDALTRCDVERLELVGRLYSGTVSGDKARNAASLLSSLGYGTSRIGVSPNAGAGGGGTHDCTALVEGESVDQNASNPCALVDVPSGWRCDIVGGRAKLVQVASTPAPSPVPSRSAYGISASSWMEGSAGSAGSVFREFAGGPEMVVVPSGSFLMGSPSSEEGRNDGEGPQRHVTVPLPFALGRYEVTFAEWDACSSAGYCRSIKSGGDLRDGDQGWGRGSRPVITVSWNDTRRFLDWLNSRVPGSPYRLPSESEWEYGARAGTTRPFSTGGTISTDMANYDGDYTYGSGRKGIYRKQTVPVGSFRSNGFGLHDVHGNVWEWVEDCYGASLPSGISARSEPGCSRRVLRGGSWNYDPWDLRSADRGRDVPGVRNGLTGFRVARTLTP